MANAILAFPNLVDIEVPGTTFSGGAWETDLPLENLQDEFLVNVARSADATLASTQIIIDFGVSMLVRVIGLVAHTISRDGQIRFRGGTDPTDFSAASYDSGWLDVWPVIYPSGSIYYGHPSWWDGRLATADAVGYNQTYVKVLSGSVARYWLIEISDESNSAGSIDIARLFMAPGWQPHFNFAYGDELGWQTDTTSETTRGGVRIFDRQDGRRVARFTLENMTTDEALTKPFEMQRTLGLDRQLLFVYDPDDTVHLQRRSFLATMKVLNPLQNSWIGHATNVFELEEVL